MQEASTLFRNGQDLLKPIDSYTGPVYIAHLIALFPFEQSIVTTRNAHGSMQSYKILSKKKRQNIDKSLRELRYCVL